MAKQFSTPFGKAPPSVIEQQLFQEAVLGNKTRTHEYRRWSDRATVLSYDAGTDSYTIALTVGSNAVDGAQTFEGVRSVVPADVRKLDPGTVVAIGYLQERREQPIILGVGTVRQKVTDSNTTPLSTIIQFPGGGLTLLHDRYDDNRQPGDPSTDQILGQDPTLLGAGGCTRHVHAVGGVGQITWTWSYDGADRIFEASGTNDFRLTFGVEGGVGGGTDYPGGYILQACYCLVITGQQCFPLYPPTLGIGTTCGQGNISGSMFLYDLGSLPITAATPLSANPIPSPGSGCSPEQAYISCDCQIIDACNSSCALTDCCAGTAPILTVTSAQFQSEAALELLLNHGTLGVHYTVSQIGSYTCGGAPATCLAANITTLTATDAAGNVATAIVSAS